uniref:Uncharacterized protein n=1 Tax=Rhizophora mucronata TaxID=61149 RepID=A0A2P2KMI7_RHIMU
MIGTLQMHNCDSEHTKILTFCQITAYTDPNWNKRGEKTAHIPKEQNQPEPNALKQTYGYFSVSTKRLIIFITTT